MRQIIVCAVLALAACSGPSKVDKDENGTATKDYDAINEVAEGPSVPITPEPMTFATFEKYDTFGAGCTVPSTDGEASLFVAHVDGGYFMYDGDLQTLSPKAADDTLPYGLTSRYDGKAYSAELTLDPATEKVEAAEVVMYTGTLTISDAKARPVFEYKGTVNCGA